MKIEKTPSLILITAMEDIETQIDELINKYEIFRKELIRRFPNLENEYDFKQLQIGRKGEENEINKTKIL